MHNSQTGIRIYPPIQSTAFDREIPAASSYNRPSNAGYSRTGLPRQWILPGLPIVVVSRRVAQILPNKANPVLLLRILLLAYPPGVSCNPLEKAGMRRDWGIHWRTWRGLNSIEVHF